MNESGRPKTLVLGLDVGDGALIRRWAGEGRLPALASLIEQGAWSWLDTTADTLHVSAWPTIYTGAMPGEHGVYFTFQPLPGVQGYEKFRGDQYGRPTFWNLLSRAGVRCTVLDAPYTHPEVGSDATQIFDWGSWARHWKSMSTPPPLLRRMERACGRYPLGLDALDIGLARLDPAEMRERLVTAVDARTRAALWLERQVAWDVLFVVFAETHPAAHYCWAPDDGSGHADGGPALDDLLAVYQAVDRGIGELVDRVGEDTTVLVVSGDGVAPNRAGWHLLPEALRRLGFLAEATPADRPDETAAGGRARGIRDPIRRLRDALPKDMRKALARRLPASIRHRLARRVDTAGIDWSRTRAFCLPTDLEGYIRVNVRGREPLGIVAEGSEYRRVCDELVAALAELTDATTGRPAVREVIRVDDAFPGHRRARLPDLVVVWDREQPLQALTSPATGLLSEPSPDARPGTHAGPGFLLRRGELGDAADEPSHIRDIAPALLSRYGVQVPEYMMTERDRTIPEGGRT